MWRAFFLALGAYSVLLGAQCLVVETAVLHSQQPAERGPLAFMSGSARNKEFTPPPWAPWTLMSTGAVTILYSFTIPARQKKP